MAAAEMTLGPDAFSCAFLVAGRVHCRDNGWIHEKTTPYTIIAQVVQGEYRIDTGGRREWIRPGEAFLTPANCPMRIEHRFADAQLMESRYVHFRTLLFGVLDVSALLDLPLRLTHAQMQNIEPRIEHLLAAERHGDDLARSLCRAEYGLALTRELMGLCRMTDEGRVLLAGARRLVPVIASMRRNNHRPVGLDELAKEANLSPSRLHALFRKYFGCAPVTYARRLRLEDAGRRLQSSDEPVYQIAEELGFSSAFHLSREFKQAFGVAPMEYRRRRWEHTPPETAKQR